MCYSSLSASCQIETCKQTITFSLRLQLQQCPGQIETLGQSGWEQTEGSHCVQRQTCQMTSVWWHDWWVFISFMKWWKWTKTGKIVGRRWGAQQSRGSLSRWAKLFHTTHTDLIHCINYYNSVFKSDIDWLTPSTTQIFVGTVHPKNQKYLFSLLPVRYRLPALQYIHLGTIFFHCAKGRVHLLIEERLAN